MAQRQAPAELEISTRVLTDDQFRQALLSDPAATLEREYGVKVPEGVKIQVHEETDQVIHLIVPGRPHRMEGQLGKGGGTVSPQMAPEGRTNCCTCGSSSAQTLSSYQKGCGC